jgi:hypothetical protein
MESSEVERARGTGARWSELHGGHLRTLEAVFRHPTAHNLEWTDIVGLLEKIGTVIRVGGDKFGFTIAEQHYVLHKPHTKDLPSAQVAELRQFLTRAGWAPGSAPQPLADPSQQALTLVVVVDHHGAKIFRVDAVSGGTAPKELRPYDPHHFLHHLAHKDQSREEGQRAAEDPSFYKRISEALAAGSRIVVIGHGAGKSNAAKHLTEYLRTHHRETYQRIVSELEADLSAVTAPQLLELAEQALGRTA